MNNNGQMKLYEIIFWGIFIGCGMVTMDYYLIPGGLY